MTEQQATALATALGGDVARTMPRSGSWGVAVTRADGRYVLLEQDAGAVYFDEHACWIGYHTHGSDPEGDISAEEWGDWCPSREWASGLATLIGGEAYHSGGNIWLVFYERRDGRFVLIGDTGCEVYASREHYEDYRETQEDDPEVYAWD